MVFHETEDMLGVARAELAYSSVLGDWQLRADAALIHVERMIEAYARLGFPSHGTTLRVYYAIAGGPSQRSPPDRRGRACTHYGLAAHRGVPRMQLARVQALSGDIAGARASAARATTELEDFGEELGRGYRCGLPSGCRRGGGDWE